MYYFLNVTHKLITQQFYDKHKNEKGKIVFILLIIYL